MRSQCVSPKPPRKSLDSDARSAPDRRGCPRSGSHAQVNVARVKAYCRAFAGVSPTLYGDPYNFLVYTVGGRKFAYFKTSEPERWRFSVRVTPDRFVELTDIPGVKPARWRGRYGWITIVDVSSFPETYLKELIEASYERALDSLSKAARRSIGIRGASGATDTSRG
jgi:predicted DNA-binding protein (MmcQ/YjbR family)